MVWFLPIECYNESAIEVCKKFQSIQLEGPGHARDCRGSIHRFDNATEVANLPHFT